MSRHFTRRDWLRSTTAMATAGWLGQQAIAEPAPTRTVEDYQMFFGDLHNHNNVGYAQGSVERAFEIAREHLDFFACTPHGWWPDIGHYENQIENKWLKGFEVKTLRFNRRTGTFFETDLLERKTGKI